MSFSNRLAIAFALCACVACRAAEPHRYECPSPLMLNHVGHVLAHVHVYDGPPKNGVDLEAWDSLEGIDPYLVCHYEGTDKVVTIHAIGSKSCDAADHPAAAFCD
jgi:hypothetical protein